MNRPPDQPDVSALVAEAAWVRRLAGRLLDDEHQAEDAAQEALTIALERRSDLESGALRNWMGRVVRHLARRWPIARARRRVRERQAARIEVCQDGPSDLERLELHQRLAASVMELEDPYRSTLVLHFLDGLNTREIARRQGIAPAAVRKRLSRGLAMLRSRLDRTHGDGRGWASVVLPLALEPHWKTHLGLGALLMNTQGKIASGALEAF